jgi:hypothetical protein
MPGWRKATRVDAGSDGAKEMFLQTIFDKWTEQKPPDSSLDNTKTEQRTPIAGVPDWLWVLPSPERPSLTGFGYKSQPDAFWENCDPRVVGELKYGTKYEPFAVAEVLHYAHLLRRKLGGAPIRSVVISQLNYCIRAAVSEISSPVLQHVEADLLSLGSQKFLWLSCPHANLVGPSAMPPDVPLKRDWTSLRWFGVEGEPTWIAHDEAHDPPFLQGSVAMLSRFRNSSRYQWMLWTGKLPEWETDWSKIQWAQAGSFWIWDTNAEVNHTPPAPPCGSMLR